MALQHGRWFRNMDASPHPLSLAATVNGGVRQKEGRYEPQRGSLCRAAGAGGSAIRLIRRC